MITSIHLKDMSGVKISEVNKADLIDIKTVEIDTEKPIEKRIDEYLKRIKNPYCFLYGDIGVKIEFSEEGKKLEDLIKNYLISLKNR